MASEDYSDLIAHAKTMPTHEDYSDLIDAAGTEEGGPESFLHPDKFKPSSSHRKFYNIGSIEDVRRELDSSDLRPQSFGEHEASALLSAADRASGGGLTAGMRLDRDLLQNPVSRAVDAIPILGPLIGKRGGQQAQDVLDNVDKYRRHNPTLSAVTDAPSYLTGAPEAIGNTFSEKTAELLAKAPGLGPMMRSLASHVIPAAGTSGALQTTQALAEGAEPAEALREGGHAAASGAMIATPLTVMARAGGSLADKALESRGGQTRQFLERHGVTVGPKTPGSGGPMDSMVTQGTTDADIGRQAEVSAQRGLDSLNQEKKAVMGILGRRIGGIEGSPEAAHLQDVSEIVQNMRAAMEELDTSPQARTALGDLVKSVESKQGQGFNGDTDNYLLSQTDVNKLRRQLDRYAKTGTSTDASLSPLKSAAGEARTMVDEGPFSQANKDYAEKTKYYQKSRRMLGINERPKTPDETQAAVSKVKNLITRRGQNTVTAGGQESKLAEFEARHPQVAEEFARPEILRKRADLNFRLLPPEHGGLIERDGAPLHGAAIIHEALRHLFATAGSLVPLNKAAIQARLLYGPALGLQALMSEFGSELPQLSAGAAQQERR